jgi:hypothetical protein
VTDDFPMQLGPGVVVQPPRLSIREAIDAEVAKLLPEIPEGHATAVIAIDTERGVNLVIAGKFGDGWSAAAYVGKSWGTGPIVGGARLMKTF